MASACVAWKICTTSNYTIKNTFLNLISALSVFFIIYQFSTILHIGGSVRGLRVNRLQEVNNKKLSDCSEIKVSSEFRGDGRKKVKSSERI